MGADPLREILLGFVRLHILHHAGQGETYGAWLMNELRRHGYGLGPGTLYPTLHALEEGVGDAFPIYAIVPVMLIDVVIERLFSRDAL